MEKYSIILPNEKAKTYDYVTLFVLLINLFVFGFVYFKAIDRHLINLSLCGFIICLLALAFLLLINFRKSSIQFHIKYFFTAISVLWFLMDRWPLAVCILCFEVIGVYARRKLEVIFTKNNITYPSFPQKVFLWKDVSNVILKDGMLTIDLKNNKLIQIVIEKGSAESINEREFNFFCKSQLVNLEI